MLQANKVLRLARSNKKKLSKQPDESLKGVFGQHDLLSIGHNVDLELTLPLLLGPVPWSLSTPDRISIKNSEYDQEIPQSQTADNPKTDKSKLPHGL